MQSKWVSLSLFQNTAVSIIKVALAKTHCADDATTTPDIGMAQPMC